MSSKLYFVILFSLHCLLLAVVSHASETEIRYFQTDLRYEYRIKLLDLALSKNEKKWGAYLLIPESRKMTQGRGALLLEYNEGVDVAFFPTSIEREIKFRAIQIPILQGILGYRVLLINRDKLYEFSKIKTFKHLKQNYVAGFGEHWVDITILKANEIKVIGAPEYELLFAMLNRNRFDHFPRGINEAWNEIQKYKKKYPKIMIEPNIALYYPYYVYFFVSKNNKILADRILNGLELALKDGSFKALFLEHHQHLFEQASLSSRRIFTLENPSLPQKRGDPKLEWWLPPQLQERLLQ